MICKNCSAEIDNSASFCVVCGTPVEKAQPVYQAPEQPAYQAPAYQAPEQPAYQAPAYQAPEQPAYQPPVYQAPVAPAPAVVQPAIVADNKALAPVTSIGQYIGWSLVTMIPLIGFIMMIVWAIDTRNMNRANYFRAIWVVALISVVLIILPFFLLGGAALLGGGAMYY